MIGLVEGTLTGRAVVFDNPYGVGDWLLSPELQLLALKLTKAPYFVFSGRALSASTDKAL